MMLCKKLHHAAYRCGDAKETVEFYTTVLGLKFTHAMGEDHVPSTGEYSPHIHIFFEMEDGSNIAFFEVPHSPPGIKDRNTPDWVQHFAFEVESVDTLMRAKAELEAKGVQVLGPTNHDDFILSIYFHDPSGHRLELTARTATPEQEAQFLAEAIPVLDCWSENHDWSNRARVFGIASGYRRHVAKEG